MFSRLLLFIVTFCRTDKCSYSSLISAAFSRSDSASRFILTTHFLSNMLGCALYGVLHGAFMERKLARIVSSSIAICSGTIALDGTHCETSSIDEASSSCDVRVFCVVSVFLNELAFCDTIDEFWRADLFFKVEYDNDLDEMHVRLSSAVFSSLIVCIRRYPKSVNNKRKFQIFCVLGCKFYDADIIDKNPSNN